ncbi:glycosyltransferase [Sporosarcina sp. FSL K6-2383]|uniref:glycosyltransferase family 2 protein n=1 Tax=Sporosarcina sp. FSL K6-2383 TaxID=2921556 RepID=UPI00315AD28A
MNEQPLVSLIISAYNHEKYIEECLESIMNQTYKNIELILFNDGSKDSTHEKILGFKSKLKERFTAFEYINKENEGISKNFNIGIKKAKGKYIKTFASDDFLFENAIELLVNGLENEPDFDIAYADGYYVYAENERLIEKDLTKCVKFSGKATYISGNIHDHLYDILPHMSSWTVLFKKECFDKYGLYDENLRCEDMDLYLRFSKESKFLYLENDVAIHRLHDNNAGFIPEIMISSVERMIEKYTQSNFFESELHKRKLERWLIFTKRVLLPLNFSHLDIGNKKVFVWGTGEYCKNNIHLVNNEIEFFLDSNLQKVNTEFMGKLVKHPNEILNYKSSEIFILVLSTFVDEIFEWLEDNGLKLGENYY